MGSGITLPTVTQKASVAKEDQKAKEQLQKEKNISFDRSKETTEAPKVTKKPQIQERSILGDWKKFIEKVENNLFAFAPNKTPNKQENFGNISAGEKILHSLKGVAQIFTTMLKNPVQTGIGIVAFAAVSSFLGPLAPLLIAGAFTIGSIGAIASLGKAEKAKSDEEARKAYQSFGANMFTALTALFGARAAVKTAEANGVGISIKPDDKGIFRNLAECYRLSFGGTNNGTSIYGAVKHSWTMKINQFRETQKDSDFTTKLKSDKTTAESDLDAKKKALDHLDATDPSKSGAKQKLANAETELQAKEITYSALKQDQANAPAKIAQLEDEILHLEQTINRGRAAHIGGLPHINGYSQGAQAGQTAAQLQELEFKLQLTRNTLAYYRDGGQLSTNLQQAQINYENALTAFESAKAGVTSAETAVAEATSALTKAKDALSAAQSAPSFFGELTTGFWDTARVAAITRNSQQK